MNYEWNAETGWTYTATEHEEVPQTLQCICETVVRVFLDGRRYDAATGDPHVHVLPEATPVPQVTAPPRQRPPAPPESRYEGELA